MRILFFLILSIHIPAAAEYRMFLLQITGSDGKPKAQIRSNLDPDQYRGYYPLKEGETITYTDTWMCWDRTNDKPACPSPRDLASVSDTNAPAAPPTATTPP